ncbi:hypothetical protein WJX81_003533 [Elliptochloris bilobata]|uniref:Nudix hydrolase domain-containing protein n=1 Tax=Elliptochloris bilobata TaxID=381761 RepID=A0AAW1S7I8_9CHLO
MLPSAEVLDDLCSRFILNVPAEELGSFEKLMFLVEQAHWFYEDYYRDRDTRLSSMPLKAFMGLIFQHCPGLAPFAAQRDAIHAQFTAFKQSVPVMGAILLEPNLEKVLLVRGFQAAASWGFPRGKVSKDETDAECAVREVREETGFDIRPLLVEGDCIEMHIGQQRSKLFIITGVDERTHFAPLVRGEIGGFAWHLLADLPATKEAATLAYHTPDGSRHKFYMVWPYVKQLRHWVRQRRRQGGGVAAGKPVAAKALANADPAPAWLARGAEQAQEGAVTTHVQAPPEPGQAWLKFCFNREDILRHLPAVR